MRQLIHPVRRDHRGVATLGIMASFALLVAWTFVNRTGATQESSELLLLELLTVFLSGFGTLIVAGMLVGLLPFRRRGH